MDKNTDKLEKKDLTISDLKAQILGLKMDVKDIKTEKGTLLITIEELTKFKDMYLDLHLDQNTRETQDSDDEDWFAENPSMKLLGYQDNGASVYQSAKGLLTAAQGPGKEKMLTS